MNKTLRSARLKKGWSQEEAAEAVQVSVRTYQRWECEEALPNFASRRLARKAFEATDKELGFDCTTNMQSSESDEQQQGVALTSEELVALSDLLSLEGNTMVHFDASKRNALRKLLVIAALTPQELVGTESWKRLGLAQQKSSVVMQSNLDLDVIDDYAASLRGLLARGEAQYVMRAAQKLYNNLMQECLSSTDIRLAETQFRLGMLVGAAQEYALPWYQRDQAVMQTYNHIEDTIIQKVGVESSLHHEYVRLLAKRGRQHRVLWQFDTCVKECEDGLSYVKTLDDSSLSTHFLCERAHIEATRGDELLWLHKLEEARRGVLDMNIMERAKSLYQVDYMQGEGYKRFAFHTQKDMSIAMREKYARLALTQFSQWNGTTIELPGFEMLVVQVSKAQCLILIDPDEALRLAGQARKRIEQCYPALLDKIHRVTCLAQQRLQMSGNDFLQMFKDASNSAYHTGRNFL